MYVIHAMLLPMLCQLNQETRPDVLASKIFVSFRIALAVTYSHSNVFQNRESKQFQQHNNKCNEHLQSDMKHRLACVLVIGIAYPHLFLIG